MVRQLKPRAEYSCEELGEETGKYKVCKLSPGDLDVLQEYTVNFGHGIENCDCYAGLMGKRCRHIQLVELFIAHAKVGSVATYCFDRKEWR